MRAVDLFAGAGGSSTGATLAGLEVVAAPTAFRGPAIDDWMSFVPSWYGLKDTSLALHEWCGRFVYWFRG